MLRAFTGTTLIAAIAWFGTGHPAAHQDPVRGRVACESLAGLAVPATSIGLPTSGATIGAADLVSASRQTVTADRAISVRRSGR